MYKKIYFAQYGGIWAATPEQAVEICKQVLADKGYELETTCVQLKRTYKGKFCKPWPEYYHKVYNCLDWTKEEWQELLDELTNTKRR